MNNGRLISANYMAMPNGALKIAPKIDTEVAGERMKGVSWTNLWKAQRMMTWKKGLKGKTTLPIPSNHILHRLQRFLY
jgi:hypothetical protein